MLILEINLWFTEIDVEYFVHLTLNLDIMYIRFSVFFWFCKVTRDSDSDSTFVTRKSVITTWKIARTLHIIGYQINCSPFLPLITYWHYPYGAQTYLRSHIWPCLLVIKQTFLFPSKQYIMQHSPLWPQHDVELKSTHEQGKWQTWIVCKTLKWTVDKSLLSQE